MEYTVSHPSEELMEFRTYKHGGEKYCWVDWTKFSTEEQKLRFNDDYAQDDFTPKYVIAFLQFNA